MKILFLILTLYVISTYALNRRNVVKIWCSDVRRFEWTHAGFLNICFIRGDLRSVNKFTKATIDMDTGIEAIGFQAQSRLNYIPHGLKECYRYLVGLYFDDTPLLILTEENMAQFGTDLIHFHVTRSLITHLSKNLFKHNPNLKFLSLYDNPIQYIESGFFKVITRMDNLLFFDVRKCRCINDFEESSKDIKRNEWTNSCA